MAGKQWFPLYQGCQVSTTSVKIHFGIIIASIDDNDDYRGVNEIVSCQVSQIKGINYCWRATIIETINLYAGKSKTP